MIVHSIKDPTWSKGFSNQVNYHCTDTINLPKDRSLTTKSSSAFKNLQKCRTKHQKHQANCFKLIHLWYVYSFKYYKPQQFYKFNKPTSLRSPLSIRNYLIYFQIKLIKISQFLIKKNGQYIKQSSNFEKLPDSESQKPKSTPK